jgi:hypothetical protein
MGTTGTYGLRYQELGDAPDGPNLGKNLAEDVEAELVRMDAAAADDAARLDTLEDVPVGRAEILGFALANSTTTKLNAFTNATPAILAGGVTLSADGLTVPKAGLYRISLVLGITTPSQAGFAHGSIEINGSINRTVMRTEFADSSPTVNESSGLFELAAGDLVGASVFHNAGAGVSTHGSAQYATGLEVTWIRA